MFAEIGTRFRHNKAMGIYLSDAQEVPTARALYVDGLENWSQLDGGDGLDCDYGRLVGVAPEALGASGTIIHPSLEQSLAIVNKNLGDVVSRRK